MITAGHVPIPSIMEVFDATLCDGQCSTTAAHGNYSITPMN